MLWGLLFAVLLIFEKLWLLPKLKKHRFLAHVYTLFFVAFCFIIFNAQNLKEAFLDLSGLFGARGIPLVSDESLYCLRSFGVVLFAGAIGATPALGRGIAKISETPAGSCILAVLEPVCLLALTLVMTAYLVDGSFNPFLYFRF